MQRVGNRAAHIVASEGPLRVTDEFWMEDASLAVLVCATEDRRFIPRGNYRALLCRKCDIAIHTTNPYVSSHQRFVLTGVKVGLEISTDYVGSSSNANHLVMERPQKLNPVLCLKARLLWRLRVNTTRFFHQLLELRIVCRHKCRMVGFCGWNHSIIANGLFTWAN
ncbi:hypothetical protein V6N12_046993 [Hibiscus sabdariffa]|uniref:Uncharacterized protein n=1 Tax=Hibiscus sabdariffa TaxID=183260 RepID=A0ABR2BCA9_9ROSI